MWKEPEQREVISAWGAGRRWAKSSWGRWSGRKCGNEEKRHFAEERGAETGVFGALGGPGMVPGMTGVRAEFGGGDRPDCRALEAVVRGSVFDLRTMGSH